MQTQSQRRTSKKLTNYVTEAYRLYQKKLAAGRKERDLDKEKKVLDQRILGLIDSGYTVLKDSKLGVMVLEESEALQYKALYTTLVNRLTRRIPEHREYIADTARRLVREGIRSVKRSVVYDTNQNLEKRIQSIESPREEERRNGIKKIDLVLYS